MSTGDNKCANCGQWAGRGHSCPTPALAPALDRPAAPNPDQTASDIDTNSRVARAQAVIATAPSLSNMPRNEAMKALEEAAKDSPEAFKMVLDQLRHNPNMLITGKDGITRINLSRAMLSGADLSRLHLHNLNLIDAVLNDVNFNDSVLDGSTLSSALISDSTFQNASLQNTDLTGTRLHYCDVRGADFDGAKFVEYGYQVKSGVLAGTNVHGAHLGSARIHPDCLEGTNGRPNWGPTEKPTSRNLRSYAVQGD